MPKYVVNEAAVAKARHLIDARQYVLRSRWSDVQPTADMENAFLEAHDWDEYGEWVHGALDAVGFIPGLGEIADGINGLIYLGSMVR